MIAVCVTVHVLAFAFGRREGVSEPVNTSDMSAKSLLLYLKHSMPTPAEFSPNHAHVHLGSQTPASTSGRVLYALATHPKLNTIVVYFMGYAGANGVYCIARGLERKHKSTGVRGRVITADNNLGNIAKFRSLLRMEGLDGYVHVRHRSVGSTDLLYKGQIDLFVEDMDGSTPLETIDNVLRFDSPRVYMSENTRGIGANHATKADYARAGQGNAVVLNVDSGLYGVKGRAFSLFVNPHTYASIRRGYGDLGCTGQLSQSDQTEMIQDYVGWGWKTDRLSKRFNVTSRCVWDLVTCHLGTLCPDWCKHFKECASGMKQQYLNLNKRT